MEGHALTAVVGLVCVIVGTLFIIAYNSASKRLNEQKDWIAMFIAMPGSPSQMSTRDMGALLIAVGCAVLLVATVDFFNLYGALHQIAPWFL